MELIAASHTKRTQRQFHKTRIKNIMAKQDLLLKDFLHGSNVDFIELQSDMRGIVIIILDLFDDESPILNIRVAHISNDSFAKNDQPKIEHKSS